MIQKRINPLILFAVFLMLTVPYFIIYGILGIIELFDALFKDVIKNRKRNN